MWKCIFCAVTNRGLRKHNSAVLYAPVEGEYDIDLHPSQCAWFDVYPERYMWDGTALVEWSGWEAEQAARELTAWKQQTVAAILASFAIEVKKPVMVGTLQFDGGWTSLDKMDRAIQFADRLNLTERTFYETDETPHVLPIHGEGLTGDSILIAIAMAYDTLDGKMRAMVKQVNDAETVETFSISWE